MAGNLTERTIRSIGWQFTSVASQALLQILILAILSRLIPPSQFGIVGIAMIFVNFSLLFSDFGISGAMVQRKELTKEHIHSGFTLSFSAGIIFSGAIYYSSGLWALFFNESAVKPILKLLSICFLFTSWGWVSGALLWREMRFKAIAVVDIVSYLIGYGCIGVYLAFHGYEVWALTWAIVVQSFLKMAIQYFFVRHPLKLIVKKKEALQLLNFGVGLSLARFFNFLANKGDYIVTGRWLGTEALGLYERAFRLIDISAAYFAGIINKVTFPLMSEIQDEKEHLKKIYLRGIALISLVYIPLSVIIISLAEELIITLFGNQWSGAIAPLQILSVGLLFRASYKLSDALSRSVGAVYRSSWRIFVFAVSIFIGAIIGQNWGIEGIAIGITFAFFIKFFLLSHLCLTLISGNWMEFIQSHLHGLLLGIIFIGLIFSLKYLLNPIIRQGWLYLIIIGLLCLITGIVLFLYTPEKIMDKNLLWIKKIIKENIYFLSNIFR